MPMAEPVDAGLKLDGAYAEPAAMVPPPSVPVEAVLLELLELELVLLEPQAARPSAAAALAPPTNARRDSGRFTKLFIVTSSLFGSPPTATHGGRPLLREYCGYGKKVSRLPPNGILSFIDGFSCDITHSTGLKFTFVC